MFTIILIPYGLFLICGCALQRKLLYFPKKIPSELVVQAAAERGFAPWKNPADEIIGWKMASSGTSTGSVLVVHGNGGYALSRNYIAQPIHDAGSLDVFVLEYPGYGARGGSPSLKSWLAAGEEAFSLIPKDKPVYLVSESLGTGVAAHLAKTHLNEVAGMVMFVPYNSLAAVAQNRMPLLMPYLTLLDRYKPAAWLKEYRGPIKFVLAEFDTTVPPKFGQRLFDSYQGRKSLQVIQGAIHNEASSRPSEWWKEVFSFWQQ